MEDLCINLFGVGAWDTLFDEAVASIPQTTRQRGRRLGAEKGVPEGWGARRVGGPKVLGPEGWEPNFLTLKSV